MNKRCTNCGKYPFCKAIRAPGRSNECEKWIKRQLTGMEEEQMKNQM